MTWRFTDVDMRLSRPSIAPTNARNSAELSDGQSSAQAPNQERGSMKLQWPASKRGERDAMTHPPRCFLVVSLWCINPHTGSGQRTQIFFSALKMLGPTGVILLAPPHAKSEAAERFFPGHAGLHIVETKRISRHDGTIIGRAMARIDRLIRFTREYRGDPEVLAQVASIIGPQPSVIVYRYFHTFCLAGFGIARGRPHKFCVDVDDRDDQKLQLSCRRLLGNGLFSHIYEHFVLSRLTRLMQHKLTRSSVAWFSAESDVAGLSGSLTAVVPNIPFAAPSVEMPIPPSLLQDILFVGTYNHAPNVEGIEWFLKECWPRLHASHPRSRLRIVGHGNWMRLAAGISGTSGLDIVGEVADLAQEYGRARLIIAPIFSGGGSKIKVIEACAFGRPVVTTSHSARGFGKDILNALPKSDTSEGFVELCNRYLEDGWAADSLGDCLLGLQKAQYSREVVECRIARQITRITGQEQP